MDPVNYVYVIGRAEGPVKVGITASLISRLSSIQTGCPFKCEILYVMPCVDRQHALEHESMFHDVHSENRTSGEWFAIEAELAIESIQTQFDYEAWEEHTARFRKRA